MANSTNVRVACMFDRVVVADRSTLTPANSGRSISLRRVVGSSWSWVRRFAGRVMPRFINHTLTQRIKQRTRSASRGALSQWHTQLRFPGGVGNCSADGFVPVGGVSFIRGLCNDDDGDDSELKSPVLFALFITHCTAISVGLVPVPGTSSGFYAVVACWAPTTGHTINHTVAYYVTLSHIIVVSLLPPPTVHFNQSLSCGWVSIFS